MDMLEFKRCKTGMEDEYNKILRQQIDIIRMNDRTKESLKDRYNELHRRKERLLEYIQSEMTEFTLEERALAEISSNWNNKKYWNEE